MKQQQRVRLRLEQLEDRWVPAALSASVTNGLLSVTGVPAAATDVVTVKETAPNTFEVDDGATVVGSSSVLVNVNNVNINLGGPAAKLNVDLGNDSIGNLAINLGSDTTGLATIEHGNITGRLTIHGSSSSDSIVLGSASTAL